MVAQADENEKWGQTEENKIKSNSLHLKVRRLDSPRSHTHDQQGCMILTQSLKTVLRFFLHPFS